LLRFVELRIRGFKSFLEPVTIPLQSGLTGVIGPNGCGKSNVLEAIRWVMGASSAKALRGDAMDDVIFAGTDKRPGRDIASVTLVLDNSEHSAPAPFSDDPTLELTREIRRHRGSSFRINGQEVRGRDIRLLLADTSTGANSPALVRQGQISALVSAKPENRRIILEEAAGITGLRQRRRDSELKLDAAARDLERIEDLFGEDERQLRSLERQARMALKYREVKAELDALTRWAAFDRVVQRKNKFAEAESGLAGAKQAVIATERTAIDARLRLSLLESESEPLAERRQDCAVERAVAARALQDASRQFSKWQEARRVAERALVERDAELEAAARRLSETRAQHQAAISEFQAAKEAINALSPLAPFESEAEAASAAREAARDALREAETQWRDAEGAEALEGKNRARALARRNAAELRLAEAMKQADTLGAQDGATPFDQLLAGAEAMLVDARSAEEALEDAEATLASAQAALTRARADHERSSQQLSASQSEYDGRQRALAAMLSNHTEPAVDALRVDGGLVEAVNAGLGAAALASLSDGEAFRWSVISYQSLAALPDGATALGEFVTGPQALASALSQIGLIEEQDLDAAASHLKPGQILVTREGAMRRWDGLCGEPGHAGSQARLIAQARAALHEFDQALPKWSEEAALAQSTFQAAADVHKQAVQARDQARAHLQSLRGAASLAFKEAEAARRAEEGRAGLRRQLQSAIAAAMADFDDAEAQWRDLPQPGPNRSAALVRQCETARLAFHASESAAGASKSRLESARQAHLDAERALARAEANLKLTEEKARAAADRAALLEASAPDSSSVFSDAAETEFSRTVEEARAALDEQEARFRALDDQLAQSQSLLDAARQQARSAETAFAEAQKSVVGLEAQRGAAVDGLGELEAELAQSLALSVRALENWAQGRERPQGKLDTKLDEARKAVERIGPVNLTAEDQAREIRERLAAIGRERDDVAFAISKLRATIGDLNTRARAKLEAAFAEINDHYRALFQTLFEGGQAHLELIEADDPLDAGLEVHARPPGKQIATLSLLSGGEQALTATALIFAVFLARPAPLCTLDEVDAPLDDANVDRFCTMLEAMVERTGTPFLVITHNPVTMARMDRLIGVTMAERGVSSIVSVQLAEAEKFAEAKRSDER
jgi:chromosome segregation protein